VAGILFINEFPDYEADKAVGKNHLIVLLGKARAVTGYIIILTGIYLSIVIPTILHLTPWFTLGALITLPMAGKAALIAKRHYDDPKAIVPAMASQIQLHLLIGVLLSLGFLIDKWVF
jgi:1,4-dihydroxy-2-naphthoate octaprenyltransferase